MLQLMVLQWLNKFLMVSIIKTNYTTSAVKITKSAHFYASNIRCGGLCGLELEYVPKISIHKYILFHGLELLQKK